MVRVVAASRPALFFVAAPPPSLLLPPLGGPPCPCPALRHWACCSRRLWPGVRLSGLCGCYLRVGSPPFTG
eukprot:4354177-Alexandrium_andersonii.AAC.1